MKKLSFQQKPLSQSNQVVIRITWNAWLSHLNDVVVLRSKCGYLVSTILLISWVEKTEKKKVDVKVQMQLGVKHVRSCRTG